MTSPLPRGTPFPKLSDINGFCSVIIFIPFSDAFIGLTVFGQAEGFFEQVRRSRKSIGFSNRLLELTRVIAVHGIA
jgi:hypothetical protein